MSVASVRLFFRDLFTVPSAGRAAFYVWLRNFLYFRRTWAVSLFWIALEPIIYLMALGYGVGRFVGDVEGTSYVVFFTPGLMATTGMLVAFFESTYPSFTKLTRQKTYATILLAPVQASEIALGEIMWAASKGFLSSLAVAVVAFFLDIIVTPWIFPALLVIAVLCWIFAAFGFLMASYAKSFEWFVYAQSGFVIPLSLFCGTYFPLSQLPDFLQKVAFLMPLTHAVMAVRSLLQNQIEPLLFINLACLVVFAYVLTNWAVARMERRLVY